MIEADRETKAPKKIGREPPVCMKSVLALRNNTCLALHSMLCFVQINSILLKLKLNLLCLELDLTFFLFFKKN